MSAEESKPARAPEEVVVPAIRCRVCQQPLSSEDQVFAPPGSTAVGAYANVFGQLREVVALRRAEGLIFSGESSTELSWFSGYAWRIAGCASCRAHLGWRYEATSAALEPEVFFGLLTSAITRG